MKLQLTISLLVSDRRDNLKKCLDSILPLLKEVNSELIIVFTGKDPETLAIARQYTNHIIPFTWCDDFSKARNTGLEEASGEWFLYLDDDEWFEDTTEIIQFFKSGEYRNYKTAMYIQRNYDDWEGRSYNDAQVGRMCQVQSDVRFISPIHEGLYPFDDPRKILGSYVHHFGYVASGSASEGRKKFERNTALLHKVYAENPTAHICMQLAQEYRYVGEDEKAIEYCREGLKLAEKEDRVRIYEMWMQVHLPVMLSSIGKDEEAMREGERLLLSPHLLEVGKAHIQSILSTLSWDLDEYRKGLRYVKGFHKTMQYLERHPEKAERQTGGSVTYTTAWEHAMPAYAAGLLCAAALGDMKRFQEIIVWAPWDDEKLVKAHYDTLEKMKVMCPHLKEGILEGYYRLKTDNPYVNLQKSLYVEMKKEAEATTVETDTPEHTEKVRKAEMRETDEAERYFKICAANCPPGYMSQVVELAGRNGFSLNPLLEQISIEEWDAYTKEIAGQMEVADMPGFLQHVLPQMIDYPIYAGRLEQSLLEKQLALGTVDMDEFMVDLTKYCTSIRREADTLYREEILANPDFYALPYRYKFALLIEKVLENIEAGRYEECIALLRKSIHVYPQMTIALRRLGEYLEVKIKEPKQPVSDEFVVLGNQVKQVLMGLIANGQWGEAYGVADQLLALLPGDLEVLKMKQEIMQHMS